MLTRFFGKTAEYAHDILSLILKCLGNFKIDIILKNIFGYINVIMIVI